MIRIKFIVRLRELWNNKTPKKKIELLYKVPDMLARVFGLRTYTDDQVFWYSHYSNVLMLLYVFAVSYSI